LLRLRLLDLAATHALLRKLAQALDGHVSVHGAVGEELGEHTLARAILVEQGAEQQRAVFGIVGEVLEEVARGCAESFGAAPRRQSAMLTYLDRPPAEHLGQRAQRLSAITALAARPLTVEIPPRLVPRQVVHNGELLAPEDGSAMGHWQNTGVDEAFECDGPFVAWPDWRIRPAAISGECFATSMCLTNPCGRGAPSSGRRRAAPRR
jgi:hypothetical protein